MNRFLLLLPLLGILAGCVTQEAKPDNLLRAKYRDRLELIEQELHREILLNMKMQIEHLEDRTACLEYSLQNPGHYFGCRILPVYASWGQLKAISLLYEAAGLSNEEAKGMTQVQIEQILSDVYSRIFPGRKYEFSPINPDYLEPDKIEPNDMNSSGKQ